jgi:holo-[acyl-carrier protein] synthase
MDETNAWRHMKSAPRDGSRVLVTVRSSEQGPAEVDVAYWARADQFGIEGWRAADSHPEHVVGYPDSELKCWMPMPGAGSPSAMPAAWQGDDAEELYGSGI